MSYLGGMGDEALELQRRQTELLERAARANERTAIWSIASVCCAIPAVLFLIFARRF